MRRPSDLAEKTRRPSPCPTPPSKRPAPWAYGAECGGRAAKTSHKSRFASHHLVIGRRRSRPVSSVGADAKARTMSAKENMQTLIPTRCLGAAQSPWCWDSAALPLDPCPAIGGQQYPIVGQNPMRAGHRAQVPRVVAHARPRPVLSPFHKPRPHRVPMNLFHPLVIFPS